MPTPRRASYRKAAHHRPPLPVFVGEPGHARWLELAQEAEQHCLDPAPGVLAHASPLGFGQARVALLPQESEELGGVEGPHHPIRMHEGVG